MRRTTRAVPWRLVAAFLVVLVLGVTALGASGVFRVREMERELATAEREIAALRAETQKLTKTVEQLRNDPQAIEKAAREDLGWVRKGDTVLKFSTQPSR